ncbi:hypothetical protein AVEN_163429-1 [Araneus ventricosus]|nr:hypothetical protein AVEN_89219-1 [Araneus ventricosus]GBN91729.1 hypothetical protein AVEN_78899-1 [Araneus ventricosus]GBN91731.1 hypothetical protein AVEN_163429-1 [Araneus ventricosus]
MEKEDHLKVRGCSEWKRSGGVLPDGCPDPNPFGRVPAPAEGVVAGKTAPGSDRSGGKGGKSLVTRFAGKSVFFASP